jgi:protein TonB
MLSAVGGTLALNLVLFVLLPELVRDPGGVIKHDYTEPVQVRMPEQTPSMPPQKTSSEHSEVKPSPRPAPALSPAQVSLPEQMPTFEPLLPEFKGAASVPTPEFTPAGDTEVFTPAAEDIAAAPQVYASDALDQPVHPLAQTPFMYPLRAKRQGIEGWVKIAVQIGEDGDVEEVKVLEAEPDGVFEQSVTRGIRTWRFSPATVMGERVRARVVTTIRFELED